MKPLHVNSEDIPTSREMEVILAQVKLEQAVATIATAIGQDVRHGADIAGTIRLPDQLVVEVSFRVRREPIAAVEHGHRDAALALLVAEPWRGRRCSSWTTRKSRFGSGRADCSRAPTAAIAFLGYSFGKAAVHHYHFVCATHARTPNIPAEKVVAVVQIPKAAFTSALVADERRRAQDARDEETEARTRPCPSCQAPIGEPCRDPSGHIAAHYDRRAP